MKIAKHKIESFAAGHFIHSSHWWIVYVYCTPHVNDCEHNACSQWNWLLWHIYSKRQVLRIKFRMTLLFFYFFSLNPVNIVASIAFLVYELGMYLTFVSVHSDDLNKIIKYAARKANVTGMKTKTHYILWKWQANRIWSMNILRAFSLLVGERYKNRVWRIKSLKYKIQHSVCLGWNAFCFVFACITPYIVHRIFNKNIRVVEKKIHLVIV